MAFIAPSYKELANIIHTAVFDAADTDDDDVVDLFHSVLTEPVVTLSGNSPVLSLLDDGGYSTDAAYKRWYIHYIYRLYVNREAAGAENAEEIARDKQQFVQETLMNLGAVNGAWDALLLDSRPTWDFIVADGVEYRRVSIPFHVEIFCVAPITNEKVLYNNSQGGLRYGNEVTEVMKYGD